MIWLLLIGTAMFVLGGLMAARPSKYQKRIAALRNSAMQEGMHIKLPVSLKFPEGMQKSESPYYCLTLDDRNLAKTFRHVLRREDDSLPENISDPIEKEFCEALSNLGPDYRAAYMGSCLLGISWNETGEERAPDKLLESLRELKLKIES